MTSSLSSFAQYKNGNISKTKKDIPKRKKPFCFTLKNLSNTQELIIFYFIGTLKRVFLMAVSTKHTSSSTTDINYCKHTGYIK